MPNNRKLLFFGFITSMSVFSLWPVVFWKYIFVLFKYVVFLKSVFLCFKKLYLNVSTGKQVHKTSLHFLYIFKKNPKYANIFIITNTFKYAFVCCQRIYNTPTYSTYEYVQILFSMLTTYLYGNTLMLGILRCLAVYPNFIARVFSPSLVGFHFLIRQVNSFVGQTSGQFWVLGCVKQFWCQVS